jgi:putative ABC transport system permease protein
MWVGAPPDVMLPVGFYPNAGAFERGQRGVSGLGRLAPGVTIDAAQRDLAGVARQLEQEYPATNAGTGADVIGLRDQLVVRVRDRLYVILAAVAIILLIACANVANLQLARGAARTRELSVRAALGAGRGRIAQQLLTESAVLSLIGGAVGVAMAFGFIKVLVATIGPSLPVDVSQIRLDTRVLAFAVAASLLTGMLFGVAPAWKASRTDLDRTLRTRSGNALDHRATRNTLVVAQLALSVALLAAAGLIARSLLALEQVDPGFDTANMLTAQFRLSPAKYESPEKIWSMFERAVAELRSLPGVESAALVRASPFSQNGDVYPVTVGGKPPVKAGDAPQMLVNSITPGYFSTMRIPMLAGRDVGTGDRLGAPLVMLVNASFAARTWPGESPLGKLVRIGNDDWRTVIGVVGDTKHFMLGETQFLQGYVPYAQSPQIFTSIVVRTHGDPLELVKPVREAIQRIDRDQPVWAFSTMARDVEGGIGSTQPMTWLLGIFSLIALLVAAVGTYGVLSYTMAQRTREIGIRIALGADRRAVSRMVLGEGARLVGIAAAVGLCCALVTTHWLRSLLFGVGPNDGVTFGVVTFVLVGVALLACYVPARRASRVDPMVALRID